MDEGALGNRLLDQIHDVLGLTDRDVDAEHAEELLIFRVINAGDRPTDMKLLLGDLTNDEIVLVLPGDRNDDISARCPRGDEGASLCGIARDGHCAENFIDLDNPVSIPFDQKDFVSFGQEMLRKLETHFASSRHDDVHLYSDPPRGPAFSLPARMTWSRMIAEIVVVGQTVVNPKRQYVSSRTGS